MKMLRSFWTPWIICAALADGLQAQPNPLKKKRKESKLESRRRTVRRKWVRVRGRQPGVSGGTEEPST